MTKVTYTSAVRRKGQALARIRARAIARAGCQPRLVGFGRPAATRLKVSV